MSRCWAAWVYKHWVLWALEHSGVVCILDELSNTGYRNTDIIYFPLSIAVILFDVY